MRSADEANVDLELFWLQNEDGSWLDKANAASLAKNLPTPLTFDERGLLQGFHPMDSSSLRLKNAGRSEDEIQVLVAVPSGSVLRYGNFGLLDDDQILRRNSLSNDLILRLDRSRVLLVNGPPMTGKSTLAALVSRDLVDRYGCRIYFIVDETQILYKNLKSEFWILVGRVRRNENSHVRVLMFATCGWSAVP
ncbi:hypothetical protein P3T76_010779 [Phytophthora citrophthora]|uniref:Uncharacterized protein n=1 Tax=Phytophthora citrophthora TaxID=4793 RepID=A0AAD9GAS0_9STRA|nr:hypothetical protein P3T76_010779 [Phytophthora citrophthora]